jgi:hypothetical protein
MKTNITSRLNMVENSSLDSFIVTQDRMSHFEPLESVLATSERSKQVYSALCRSIEVDFLYQIIIFGFKID